MSESVKSHETFDEKLFDSFAEFGSFQAFQYLNGDKQYRNEQKQKFLSGEITNPSLDYPDIDLEKFTQIEESLLAMRQDVILNEKNEVVKQTYRWRLNEKIAEVRMLTSVATGDMRRFKRYSEYIYGKPSIETFAYSVNSIRSKAMDSIDSDNTELREAATELLGCLSEINGSEVSTLPTQETVDLAHNRTVDELGHLVKIQSDTNKFTAEQMKEVFDSAIDTLNATGWNVSIDDSTSKTGVTTDQEAKSIIIPQDRTVSRNKLETLIIHEVGTHIARRVNGERSRLKLLSLGLDRYEAGDEGVATMREQAVLGKVDDYRGIDGLLAVGLCLGLDGEQRDFRQVYKILEKYYLFKNLSAGKEDSLEKAQNSAWNRAVRTFRGSDCNTPGVCLTKDLIYRDGNIKTWNVIKDSPNEMLRFNIGKYDPSNPRHIWILEQLGISDQDLKDLES